MQPNCTSQNGYASILSPDAVKQGLSVRASDDHILELLKDGKMIPRGLQLLRKVQGECPTMLTALEQCCQQRRYCTYEDECKCLFDSGIDRWKIPIELPKQEARVTGSLPGSHLTKKQRNALPQCTSCGAVMAPEHGYISAFAGEIDGKGFCKDCYAL